jgi:RHS repeat-associated protein
MGRTTSWLTDVQSRHIAKQYPDGSEVRYIYENASSRVRQVIDEKGQVSQFTYNLDDTLKSAAYFNATIPTPGVSYNYDPNYPRRTSMTDGTGTTTFSYNPVTAIPTLGANQIASVDGPLPNDTIAYEYDQLGRRVSTAINGVAIRLTYDAAGRVIATTNALGAFTTAYDGVSGRVLTNKFPNGQIEARSYGNNAHDRALHQINHKLGATPISEFLYGYDIPAMRITSWSQQAGAQPPDVYSFGYDDGNQLLSGTVTNAGVLVNTFAYTYDFAENRLSEHAGLSNYTATFNALNQISTTTAPGASRTNEWDAKDRLVAVNAGNQRTEFWYDGQNHLSSIRTLVGGSEVSFRRFVWCDNKICEERDAGGSITKRFFEQGMKVEMGPNAGNYFYTRDHLGSIRELTDSGGNVRARYSYDPYGRRTKVAGDLETDFGLAGMFWGAETGLAITHFRAYDPELGRWLSRDPLRAAEMRQGPNLYAYVRQNPVNRTDASGLWSPCCQEELKFIQTIQPAAKYLCDDPLHAANEKCAKLWKEDPFGADANCRYAQDAARWKCKSYDVLSEIARQAEEICAATICYLPPPDCDLTWLPLTPEPGFGIHEPKPGFGIHEF